MFRPGEAYQFDWSHEDVEIAGAPMRVSRMSSRPRYTFMVLNLIARAAGHSTSAGP
jgi:hypothetical protein